MVAHGDRPHLPLLRACAPTFGLSLAIALVTVGVSAAALLSQAYAYPSEELLASFLANDVINLCIGAPILLASAVLARRGKWVGVLCWPGALFYVLYTYIAYVLALPLSWLTLGHIGLVVLSAYTLLAVVAGIDAPEVQSRLSGLVHERLSGGVLAGLGALFIVRAVGVVTLSLISGEAMSRPDLAVSISDIVTAPALVVGGVLLWRRRPLGYVAGLALLFQTSMLFVALMGFLVLQPILTEAPFAAGDLAVIAVMGLVCFVPFGLYLRGVWGAKDPQPG